VAEALGMTGLFEGMREEVAIREYQISNLSLLWRIAASSPYVPNRKCHSELIHHAQLQIPVGVGWINEESPAPETVERKTDGCVLKLNFIFSNI